MRRYFIDFENVGTDGLKGIDTLKADDSVYFFYGDKVAKLDVEIVEAMFKTKAEYHFIKVKTGTKNALDFWLTAYLFKKAQNQVKNFIISKDNGYNTLVECGKNLGVGIERKASICVEEKADNKVTQIPKTQLKIYSPISADNIKNYFKQEKSVNVTDEEAKLIQKAINVAKNTKKQQAKSKFYLHFVSAKGQKNGLKLYKKVKDSYDDLMEM